MEQTSSDSETNKNTAPKPAANDNDDTSEQQQQLLSPTSIISRENISVIHALLQLHQHQQNQQEQEHILQQQQQLLLQQLQQQQLENNELQQQKLRPPLQVSNRQNQMEQQCLSQAGSEHDTCNTSLNNIQESDTERRYMNTRHVLEGSGLLDIALKTAELAKQNQILQKDLDTLEYIVKSSFDAAETE